MALPPVPPLNLTVPPLPSAATAPLPKITTPQKIAAEALATSSGSLLTNQKSPGPIPQLSQDFNAPACASAAATVLAPSMPPGVAEADAKFAYAFDPTLRSAFNAVKSNTLVPLNGIKRRQEFWEKVIKKEWTLQPVAVSRSSFVPAAMAEHLMTNKKNSAQAVKFIAGDKITILEGVMHTFVTAVCPITMAGDYAYKGGHAIESLGGQGRTVILSAAIQPDFELGEEADEVVMRIVEVKAEAQAGKALPENFTPLWSILKEHAKKSGELPPSSEIQKMRRQYNEQLKQHMIFHLTAGNRLPSLAELKPEQILDPAAAMLFLEKLISGDSATSMADLKKTYVCLKKHVISLEALFNIYVHQIRNEFTVLENLLPQGYVYTIDPPSIFASQIGGVANVPVLNRLQILAFKHLKSELNFKHLKKIGFNDYSDKGAVKLYNVVFSSASTPKSDMCVPKSELFVGGLYGVKEGYALVVHNNSDAFGQNIQSEGPTSMDGIIGSFSDASCHLDRLRPDLMKYSFAAKG